MRNDTKHRLINSRRLLVLGGLKAMLASTLLARLYYLQLVKSDDFKTLSNGNRIRIIPRLPIRGDILDRNGVQLAKGVARYQLYFEREGIGRSEAALLANRLSDLLLHTEDARNRLKEAIDSVYVRYNPKPVLIVDYLQWKEVAKLQVHSHELTGTSIVVPQIRHYPHGLLTTHLLGYIAPLNDEELKKYPQTKLYHNPEYKVGKTGLEKMLEMRLQGQPGAEHMEVNAKGAYVRMLKKEDGVPGEHIRLTLNIELQQRVTEILKGQGGVFEEAASAAVIDCQSGDILALSSVPNYDGNQLIKGISTTEWNKILHHYDKPLQYKAVSNPYPPGSTFKLVTAAAALEAGVISSRSRIHCPGHFKSGNRNFHCWKRGGHGSLNVHQAIAQSCNVFFYNVASQIGMDAIADMAHRLGLGSDYDLPLDTIRSGTIPTKAWKQQRFESPWFQGDTLNSSIGQGFVATTPLQLAVMSARLATGRAIEPRLILPAPQHVPSPAETLKLDPAILRIIQQGMNMVVNGSTGTARGAKHTDPRYQFAGKTGTSQTKNKLYGNDIPQARQDRHHAMFVGYAPVSAPKYALCVAIEHGGSGSAAARLAHKIVQQTVDVMG